MNRDDASPADRDQRLAIVLAELTDQICRGEIPDFDSVCQQHPDLTSDLRELWGAVLVTDTAGAARDEMPRQHLPLTMGDYELLEEIGRGGMGVVFRACQRSLDREVAVKMILRDRLASDADMQRFLAEASAMASLQHVGIVPVYEVGDSEGRPFFSMKLIAGQTLAQMVASDPMSARAACEMLISVAEAVGAAHQAGILHRDIKPSNILFAVDGHPMLTDFGLAKHIGTPVDRTRSGLLVGTPAYMSPEQASGRRQDIGVASDVYSLGGVLYYALTGRAPFVAETSMELVRLVIEQDPPPPRTLRPGLDRDLEMIVTRCLQKPADLRYTDTSALIADLRAYLADERVSARSGHFNQVVARVFRETHHAAVLENWGLLWMWHSLVLLIASLLTWQMALHGIERREIYIAVWVLGLGAWAAVFWKMRQRMGPVTFIERQIAHVWGAGMIAISMLFPLEWWLGLDVLELAPMVAVISAMVFIIKAGMLSGVFYFQALALMLGAVAMAVVPRHSHLIFGVISAACFFIPGLKYYRQRTVDTVRQA
ncbi:serine/threonine-protein kinase [Allorhodopirellula solitaria]|uniref:Serine/threonine-protein kinase PknB n=1 Tax=Allorhodopirellula solitaria TaxID=2527987 RepID=A0A5C5XS56_9BACT|nr:serine/threonine-protein kinase [Allorhodopirellula solitaria]TWT66037.1 Serine/threonine-protein kinase PknB [Allorhodopirellula solitaria]